MGVFKGGIPYAIDVRRLIEAFPVPSLTEGRVIKHEELAGTVNAERMSHRYYSVINSWIAHMKKENGIFMMWEHNVGVTIPNPAEILAHAEKRVRQKIGQTIRSTSIIEYADRNRLDTIGQQRWDHEARVNGMIRDTLRAARKEMAIDLAPIQSLPKPKLLKQA